MIELLVGAAIGLMTLGLIGSMLVSSLRAEPRIAERNSAIQEGRVLQERLTRELRLAYGVQSASASSLTFDTYLHRTTCGVPGGGTGPAIQCRVAYSCAEGTCTRSEGPVGGAAADFDTLVSGISNSGSVFSYQPAPTPVTGIGFVGVTLEFPAEEAGEDAITLEDGAALRNQ